MTHIRTALRGMAALGAVALAMSAVPARADIPTYPNPGTQSTTVATVFSAGNTGYLRTWFLGRGGAAFTVQLGAIVNGVDRGLGINNQTFSLGQLHNYGAITAGDIIKLYVVVNGTTTFTQNPADNSGGVNHLYFTVGSLNESYGLGLPFTPTRTGTYLGFEDIEGGGDFNYTDLQAAIRTGAIPEPMTWAMMILGFGVVGGAMRRRKMAVRVTYA